MEFKTHLINKLQGIKETYEDGSKLGEYAKGRYENTKTILSIVKNLAISGVSSSSIPEPPKPPLCRVLRTGVGHFCKNCNSTMSKTGFLMLVGKRYCDNKKCPNSKPEKNYY